MKNICICLLFLYTGTLYTVGHQEMQSHYNRDLLLLPEPTILQSELIRFFFPDFFQKTTILEKLAGKIILKEEALKILEVQTETYCKKIDQPAARKFFGSKSSEIRAVFSKYTITKPHTETSATSKRDFTRLYQVFDKSGDITSKL